jgi:pimeloyl-ACP methyl ester carboxylesterase
VLAVPSTPPVDSAAATIPNRADVSKPDSTPTISPAEAPKSESAAPAPTLANRPDLSSHSQPTIPNVNADARARLAAAAAQAGLNYNGDATSVPSSASPGQPSVGMVLSEQNPLQETFAEHKLEDLLARCFKTSEAEYEKLKGDVVKSDAVAIKLSVSTFDSGRMLDMLRLLPMPVVVVHGDEDPIIPKPDEKVWDYLTMDKEDTLLPIPLPNVRHFPMLEHDDFVRLVSQFLEIPDISKLEMKERWVRRTR